MVYSIPYDLIVESCGDTSSHCEDKFPIKCFLQKLKYFLPFLVVWKVGSSTCGWIMLSITSARFHVVIDNDSLAVIALALHVFIHMAFHFSFRLIPSHVSEDRRTNSTFGPFFLADELNEADLVIDMRASEHKDIIVKLFGEFLFNIFDLKLLKADHTLFLLHLAFGEFELDGGKVVDFKYIMILLLFCSVLFIDQIDHQRNHLEIFMLTGYSVCAV